MTEDTRKDRRVKIVSLNVRYKSATVDEFIDNHAFDVSRGGIYIKTSSPFPPGTLLKFEIRLVSDQAVIAGVGRVVWKRDSSQATAEHPAGMGVKFIKIDDPSRVVIDKLVNTKADAGKAFESEAEAPEQPAPIRPGGAPSPPAPVSPATQGSFPKPVGTPSETADAGTPRPATAAPGVPTYRRATVMGLGFSAATPAPSAVSSAPAASDAPRPSPTGSMFPKANPEAETAPKQEQTVMKQAAELLEEALREAGGSMDEIGTNPLFSGDAPKVVRPADEAVPATVASGAASDESAVPAPARGSPDERPVTLGEPQRLDFGDRLAPNGVEVPTDAEKARAMVAEMSPAPVPRRLSEPPKSTQESPVARGPGEPAPPAIAAYTPRQERQKKKGGAGGLIAAVVLLAAAAGVVVTFRDKLFDTGANPSPVPTPVVSSTSVSIPPTATTGSAATASGAEAPSPSAEPSGSASASASTTASAPSASASASAAATAPRPVYQQPVRPVVVAQPAAPPPRPKPPVDNSDNPY